MTSNEQITRRQLIFAFGSSQRTRTASSVGLSANRSDNSVTLTASDGSAASIFGADASSAGIMTAADKVGLDGLQATHVRDFSSLADVRAATVGSAVSYLRAASHASLGDGGGGLYRWVKIEPGHAGKVQSADGAWWELVPANETVTVRQFGAVCDGTTDDATAVQNALKFWRFYRHPYGGRVIIPPNTAVGSTIEITNLESRNLLVENGAGLPASDASTPSLKWVGAAGGTVLLLSNIIKLRLVGIGIDGDDTADFGIKFEGETTGWGIGSYEHCVVWGCNKNPVLKTVGSGWSGPDADFGRNEFFKCSFRKTNALSGTDVDDAVFAYDQDSGVLDVFVHCEFIYKPNGTKRGFAVYVEAGTPRLHFHNCYTVADVGFGTKATGATPKVVMSDHYSEDNDMAALPNANTHQVLRNCVHVVSGGTSISWGGSAGGAKTLLIDGGDFLGAVSLTNINAPVVLQGNPIFRAGNPTFSDFGNVVWLGRSNAATKSLGAVNAGAFVPYEFATAQSGTISVNMLEGTIFPVDLSANASVQAPVNVDTTFDIGREIEFRITDDGTGPYTVSFNAVFKLEWGSYTHSGTGKTDILSFRYDGATWWETRRSIGMS